MIKFRLLMRFTAYLLHEASKDLYCNYDRKEVGWIQKERAGVIQMGYAATAVSPGALQLQPQYCDIEVMMK